ncbi:MAG: pyridoxal 5'-phosphate synthase glutaminase subunit PdxT [Chloroflexi bacterium]|nr:pyridoxal 5'-phosphate synthase glutaminase subunit PdxT [Chloroflexota bacterium]
MKIGVLALQGAFVEHIAVLRHLGVEAVPVRLSSQLEGLGGLIIPGGESTTISRLMVSNHLLGELKRRGEEGLPIWGTCAGLILLAKEVEGFEDPTLGLMDVRVRRNAFGRQVDSFEEELSILSLRGESFRGVFIRAPLVEWVGPAVRVLATIANGTAVAVQEGNFLGTAFHPELTSDLRFHRYFLSQVGGETAPI